MMRHLLPALILLTAPSRVPAQDTAEADKRIVQTVQRLPSFDYTKASQKTKDAIDRYLAASVGTEEYFQIIERFALASQKDSLLKLAVEKAGTPAAGQAIKLLFQLGQGPALQEKLATLEATAAAPLVESVASVGSKETTEAVAAILVDAKTPHSVGEAAIKGLARNTAGQHAILAAAQGGKIPEALKPAAAAALATSTDETIRTAAAKVLTMDAAAKLPPVAELVKKAGDATKGQTVYMTFCFTCHQINGQGIDFGPGLGEIGTKLAKEALYDSIFNPSAGISFGFEGWEVKTKDGNTYIGMVSSDTEKELALKVPGGIVIKVDKNNLASKEKMKVSLMTPNLHTVMSQADLVNLVEYLVSLKKK
jgi:putative heme-binding domain-containing protein